MADLRGRHTGITKCNLAEQHQRMLIITTFRWGLEKRITVAGSYLGVAFLFSVHEKEYQSDRRLLSIDVISDIYRAWEFRMGGQLDMTELLEVFFEEADEQLQHLDEGILALEKNPGDLMVIKEIFRSAHTLKGSSATMGFERIAHLTHTMENLLDGLRCGQRNVSTPVIDVLLRSVDALRELVQAQSQGRESSSVDIDEIVAELIRVQESSEPAPAVEKSCKSEKAANPCPIGCIRIDITIAKDCLMPAVRAFMVMNALSGKGEVVACQPTEENLEQLEGGGRLLIDVNAKVSHEEIMSSLDGISEISVAIQEPGERMDVEVKSVPKVAETARGESEVKAQAIQTVRVGVDRLDTLMNLIGELVINRTRIGQVEGELSSKYDGDLLIGGLSEASLHLGRVINELQEQIMKIRMLPVEQVFNRFPRMVRDLAQKAQKKINFVITGQETELDRSIMEDIVDPITHLLRNSLDHGIETPEDRAAAGKPETATVRLTAKQEENHIVIEVEDDGHGISAERVKEAAVAKGVISKDSADRLSEQDCLQLIFGAGVSTAKQVTDVSGRGVGMDVVKSNIERLSGIVTIDTELGVGTCISLRLPLTLAIVQALITLVDDRVFAIPLTAIVETSSCRLSDISTIEGRPVVLFRGAVLPLIRMSDVFPSSDSPADRTMDETVLVVVRTGAHLIGLAVDSLIGEQEVVIKSLGSFFGQIEGISGATLLGDGRIALIVDVSRLPKILEQRMTIAA